MLNRIKKFAGIGIIGNDKWEIISNMVISLSLRLIGAGAQFGFNVAIARTMGAEGLGLYSLSLTVCIITSVVARSGIDLTILRFVAGHQAMNERPRLKHGWNKMVSYVGVSSAVIAICFYFLSPFLSERVFNEASLNAPLRWMLLSIVPFGILTVLSESLRGIRRIGDASLIQTTLIPVFCLFFFCVFHFVGNGKQSGVISYVLATFAALFVAIMMWRRAMPGFFGVKGESGPTLEVLLGMSLPMAWVSITSVAMGLINTFFIGLFRSSNEIGIYSAALRLSLFLSFVLAQSARSWPLCALPAPGNGKTARGCTASTLRDSCTQTPGNEV